MLCCIALCCVVLCCVVLCCVVLCCVVLCCVLLRCVALRCVALRSAPHRTAPHRTALHCTALHCTALHCTALHCTALHCTALHCTALHCTALHCTALHCTALHCTALHCTALHCTALHCTALHCTALHCTALHCTALHCTALHCTALHCTALHCTALHCAALRCAASHRIASHRIVSYRIVSYCIDRASMPLYLACDLGLQFNPTPGSTTAYCVANLVHIKPDCRKSVLSMCSMNVCSPRERLTPITDHVFDHECDIVGLTETWLTESVKDLPLIQLLTPPGYKFLHVTRSTGATGGGIALFYKSTMKVTVVTLPQKHSSFEALERGSSLVECRTRNRVSPGSNPPLLLFRRLDIFVISIVVAVDSAV